LPLERSNLVEDFFGHPEEWDEFFPVTNDLEFASSAYEIFLSLDPSGRGCHLLQKFVREFPGASPEIEDGLVFPYLAHLPAHLKLTYAKYIPKVLLFSLSHSNIGGVQKKTHSVASPEGGRRRR